MNKQDKKKLTKHIELNQHMTEISMFGRTAVVDVVPSDRLIDLIDELASPVKVPKFVGELLDYYRNSTDVDLLALLICFKDWYFRKDKLSENEEAIDWLVRHPEKFMKAWLDGYEVEEEPKYYLDLPKMGMVNEISNSQLCWTNCEGGITEKEIKAIDERYWPFAVHSRESVGGGMNTRDKIHSAINEHIDIEDTYAYFLTREKSSFSVGTVTLDDFEEWTDSDVADLTDSIMEKINPELNENQQVVLEWLKEEKEERCSFESAIYWYFEDDVEPDIISDRLTQIEFLQVLQAFAEWGMKEVAE